MGRRGTTALSALALHLALAAAHAAAAAATAAGTASDIYVSPAGSDASGDGTRAKPFETLATAQLAARKALAAVANDASGGDVTVHLGAGRYYQSEPLVLTALDSGRGGGRMKWSGPGPAAGVDPATAAVVHGGVAVPAAGWQRSAPGSPIWSVNVSALAPPSRPTPPPAPSPTPAPPPPAPVPNRTFAHCGSVAVGMGVTGGSTLGHLWAGSVDKCCQACANHTGCTSWNYCWLPQGTNATCGTPADPTDCYLGGGAFHLVPDASRIGGSPGAGCRPHYAPPPAPPSVPHWRFFNLLENGEGATLARLPDFGSGYLTDLGCSNSDTSLKCPAGVLPAAMDPSDIGVQCNLGADWFTSLRQGVSYDAAVNTITFAAKQSSFSANGKIYLQGDKALISEPGEWALESSTGMLYLWPRDETAMATGKVTICIEIDEFCI